MNDQIFEAVVSTLDPQGTPHLTPMGVRYLAGDAPSVRLLPFKPSRTLDHILSRGTAVLNVLTDTRVFAGCVTGRRTWPTVPLNGVAGVRLACALRHLALQLTDVQPDAQRPVLTLSVVQAQDHAPFLGFNRAQAAVIEGAVLVSRLHLLPLHQIQNEMRPLQVAIDKTAGPQEREAWQWLCEAVARHALQPDSPSNLNGATA